MHRLVTAQHTSDIMITRYQLQAAVVTVADSCTPQTRVDTTSTGTVQLGETTKICFENMAMLTLISLP